MTKGLDSRRSQAGQTICCRHHSALRAVRAAASRSGGPQACPAGCARNSVQGERIDIRCKNHCFAPSAAFLQAIAFQRLLRASAHVRRAVCRASVRLDGVGLLPRLSARLSTLAVFGGRSGKCGRLQATIGFTVFPCAASKHLHEVAFPELRVLVRPGEASMKNTARPEVERCPEGCELRLHPSVRTSSVLFGQCKDTKNPPPANFGLN